MTKCRQTRNGCAKWVHFRLLKLGHSIRLSDFLGILPSHSDAFEINSKRCFTKTFKKIDFFVNALGFSEYRVFKSGQDLALDQVTWSGARRADFAQFRHFTKQSVAKHFQSALCLVFTNAQIPSVCAEFPQIRNCSYLKLSVTKIQRVRERTFAIL